LKEEGYIKIKKFSILFEKKKVGGEKEGGHSVKPQQE
jgi:hypothetical protein